MSANLSYNMSYKTQLWPQDWKRSFFIPIPGKDKAKECSNYHTTALISHANKVMLKMLQAWLQQYMNQELPQMNKLDLGKAEDLESKMSTFVGKQGNSRKTYISTSLTTLKPFTVLITTNYGKLLKRWEYQTILPIS